ncbi:MAG: efflux RND transporter periplasmic adaptor subunit, partial [Bacteroidales bacterium]
GSEREIIAKAAGIVSFPNEYVVDGRGVQQGQSLFSIECGGLMENNIHTRYTEILNEYHRSKAEYERKKELAKDKIVSESVLLSAKMEFENAEENYKHLRKNFASGKQIVTAPISGFIKQILVRNGEYVQIGQRMLVISQNRSLFIKAEVSPKYYPYLGHIIGANVRELNGSKTYSLNDLHGKLISYGKSTDFESPLIPIVFEIDNKLEVIPGSFVDLYIKTEGDGWALTVPKGALIEEMGNFFVLVQINPELFEKRAVIKGVGDGFRVEIKQGLEPGERIVSKGAILIKLAQVSGGLDAHSGHVH